MPSKHIKLSSKSLTGIECLDSLVPESQSRIGLHAFLGITGVGLTRIESMICANLAVDAHKTDDSKRSVLWMGSQERLEVIREQIQSYLTGRHLPVAAVSSIKFNDVNSNKPAAFGLVASAIANCKPYAVVIDDFEMLIQNQLENPNSGAAVSRLMNSVLPELSSAARREGIPIFITHKLKGKLGTAKPNAILSHRDAASCKRFGEHIDTSFTVGTHSPTGLFKVSCTKPVYDRDARSAVVRLSDNGSTLKVATDKELEQFTESTYAEPKVVVSASLIDLMQQWESESPTAYRMVRAVRLSNRK